LTAVLEVPAALESQGWQVGIWHSADGGEWDEVLLDPVPPGRGPFDMQSKSTNARLFYSKTLSVRSNLQFTLRFRHDESASWRWTRDELGISDGHIIVGSSSTSDLPSNLSDLITDLDPAWQINSLMSQASRSRLWSLTTEVPGAKDDVSSRTSLPVGVPFGDYIRSVHPSLPSCGAYWSDMSQMVCSYPNLDTMACTAARQVAAGPRQGRHPLFLPQRQGPPPRLPGPQQRESRLCRLSE
jgi:hypothetical protein